MNERPSRHAKQSPGKLYGTRTHCKEMWRWSPVSVAMTRPCEVMIVPALSIDARNWSRAAAGPEDVDWS